jgi:hypothetical protein
MNLFIENYFLFDVAIQSIGFLVIRGKVLNLQIKANYMSHLLTRNALLIGLIALAVISRILPHPHNFTPIGAIALFGSAYFSKKWVAASIPFVAMWLSDLFINNVLYARMFPEVYTNFQWFGSAWVYASFFIISLMGMFTLRKISALRVGGSAIAASVLFFAITNFAVWIGSSQYPQNLAGLAACYGMALPFFSNTMLGDMVYATMLFGVFEWVKTRYPRFAQA